MSLDVILIDQNLNISVCVCVSVSRNVGLSGVQAEGRQQAAAAPKSRPDPAAIRKARRTAAEEIQAKNVSDY